MLYSLSLYCFGRQNPPHAPEGTPPPHTFDSDDDWEEGFYRVSRILDHRKTAKGAIEYEIDWLGTRSDGTKGIVRPYFDSPYS